MIMKLSAKINSGRYAFVRGKMPNAIMTFLEEEGWASVVRFGAGEWSCVSLTVTTDLNALGVIAAVSRVLADNKIPCNVVSAYYHDHIFVPHEKAKTAVDLISQIAL
jgi:hypothetical protein